MSHHYEKVPLLPYFKQCDPSNHFLSVDRRSSAYKLHAEALSISAGIPGTNSTAGSAVAPGAYIANFYELALMLGGVLAFGAVVYGGVLYAISAGNPSKQTEGKEWIESALIGLLLLAGAYLILYTVNPNLTNINLPAIPAVQTTPATGNTH